jgi:uncharacterized protein (TIGR00297 family)
MSDIGSRLVVGLALSLAIGGLAYWRRSLSASGVVGAVLVGTAIFGFGGWVRGLLLIVFFISSSLLSHYHDRRKAVLAEKFAKGNRRDLGQALANGGVAALLALAISLTGGVSSEFYAVLALAFYGALATANADTWATELGVLARSQPRLLTTGRPVPVGTSGGVTAAGFAAALAGATFIGAVGFVLVQAASRVTTGVWLLSDWIIVPVAAVSGFLGSACDSLLGATVQAIYVCDQCGVETERTVHRCGLPTRLNRGWRWLNNDWVNFLASAAGALVAGVMAAILF